MRLEDFNDRQRKDEEEGHCPSVYAFVALFFLVVVFVGLAPFAIFFVTVFFVAAAAFFAGFFVDFFSEAFFGGGGAPLFFFTATAFAIPSLRLSATFRFISSIVCGW